MERKIFIKKIAFIVIVASLFIAACNSEKKQEGAVSGQKSQTFTCPMHPQVVKNEMSTCPICGMDLVPFDKNSNDKALKIDAQRQALANITTVTIGENGWSGARQLNGRLVINPEQSSYIASRIAGRIEKLYVKETGVPVRKGQPVYQLYSEQLATLQQEYLMALAQEKQFKGDKIEQQIVASARQKLLLYGQSDAQVKQLAGNRKAAPFVTYYAPEGGIVAELSAAEGQYVGEGSPILRLEGYGQLWVEADVYPAEAAKIKAGQKVKVVVAGWEDQPQKVTVSFISPALQAGTQLSQLRGSIPNPGNQWQPGLQANVFLPSGNAGQGLTLPVDAVIRDGKGVHVWIKKGKDHFEPRLVKTGQENDARVEVVEGLYAGEQVVVKGAYLLYSEYILKKGKNPMEGLKLIHANHAPGEGHGAPIEKAISAVVIKDDKLNAIYQHYIHLSNALINADLAEAKVAANAVQLGAKEIGNGAALAEFAGKIAVASDIEGQRTLFSGLSNDFISKVKAAGLSFGKLYVEYCPMALNDKGASWLSNQKEIRNPYFGESMMTCGEIKETISM